MIHWNWSIDGWIVLLGMLSACSCALLGNYLVLRRLSLMGDAISHAVLPGLAIAFIVTQSRGPWPMFVGAVVIGVLTAVLTQAIVRYGRVEPGAAMGVVFSILFALGLVLIRKAADHVDLDPGCVLYGNIVQVPLDAIAEGVPPVVLHLAAVLLANALFVALFYKELKVCAFDPDLATTLGINSSLMHYLLMIMVAVTTVANFEAVGSILVIAMLIVPAAAARLLTDRLSVMILFSLVFASISALAGHVLAAFGPGWVGLNVAANTAAMMAVVTGAILAIAIVAAPENGLIAGAVHRWSLACQIVRQDILGLLYRWSELQSGAPASMRRSDVLAAIGDKWMSRWTLRQLLRRRQIALRSVGAEEAYALTPAGTASAARLIGSHRLWETYLAKHFKLSSDHLHEAAERMEHYITPALKEELRDQLVHPAQDPHGRPIPQEP